jgi:uncharacterized membrane protein (UPF0127 family)
MNNAEFMRTYSLIVFCALALLPLRAQDISLPNTGLVTTTLHVGKADIKAEIAATPQEDARGLMYRHSLGDNAGMLFFLAGPQMAQFWMKNCFIPLSVAFIGKDGTILEIHDMQPPPQGIPDDQEPLTRSDSGEIFYALEANLHWFSLNGVKPGDKVTPSLELLRKLAIQNSESGSLKSQETANAPAH